MGGDHRAPGSGRAAEAIMTTLAVLSALGLLWLSGHVFGVW